MGKHCLLLLLSFSLLLGFLQALSCFQCELLNSEGICEKGESTCETEHDQQCSMVEVSTGVYAREVSGGPACSWEGDKVLFTVRTTKQCVCADASLKGSRIQYTIQECSNLCINQTFTERYITVKYTCCNNTSFCNQP